MNTKNVWAAWLCVATLATAGVTNLEAQQPAPQERRAPSGTSEGIGVHGYWKIDVRNADGTLASHTEFENALTDEGQSSLVNMLLGANTVSNIYIQLRGPFDASPCANFIPLLGIYLPAPCFIAGSDLTTAVQSNPQGALVLTGSTTANHAGIIDSVFTTTTMACGVGIVPCGPSGDPMFTGFSLAGAGGSVSPIPVTAGQLVQVSVTLSFS
jgi:hypothetical protein